MILDIIGFSVVKMPFQGLQNKNLWETLNARNAG